MAFSNNTPIFSLPRTEIPGWLFFFVFVTVASVRARAASADSDADDALSDFTNDLFTDLGPLLALFGEQMTKQYISESTTYYDYFIFGMGPIGVITTIVSTIRLCGPASLRAFIGRSQEGDSAIEAELCTSTSRDVCEVFNNGGITRVLGRPKILELIRVPRNYLDFSTSDGLKLNKQAGLYLFRDFVKEAQGLMHPELSEMRPEWGLYPDQELNSASQNPPNLSLNIGITQYEPWVFCLVALVGLSLQAGVLVVAGVGVWVLGWNLNDSTTTSTNYAPTIFIIGTVLMCGGMCTCITIIGKATTKIRCKRATSVTGSPKTSLIWLQPQQVIADQSFDSCAYIEDDEKRLKVWTSSIKTWDLDPGSEIKFKSATCIAVLTVLVGYILQFIGSRGMRAWVSIAQLITTVVMSILRGMLRMQRTKKEDNQLLRKAELVQGHELDWLAVEISQRESLNGNPDLEDRHKKIKEAKPLHPRAMPSTTSSQQSYQNLMNLRICLAGMTGHVSPRVTQSRSKQSEVPWGAEVSKVHDKAQKLAAALEQVANIFCKRKRKISLNFLGSQFCRPPGITNEGSQDEKSYEISLEPLENQNPSGWGVDPLEIEAILGLALWSLISDRRLLYNELRSHLESSRAEEVPIRRVISAGLDPRELNSEIELACWCKFLDVGHSDPFPHGTEKMTLPLDADLDSYSLGSLWVIDKSLTTPGTRGDLKEEDWLDMQRTPQRDFPPTERFCGWSCVLGAQQNIQSIKQSLSEKALGHPEELPKRICIQLAKSESTLLDVCVQELFGAFLSELQMQGDFNYSFAPFQRGSNVILLKKKAETIKAISKIFSLFGLGSETDAINCILPALEGRQIGDYDRVVFVVLSVSDILLERHEHERAYMIIRLFIVRVLSSRMTREEERFFARALCMLSKIQRSQMCNDDRSEINMNLVEIFCNLWEAATWRDNAVHLQLATTEELHKMHRSLWELLDDEDEKGFVYDKLLEALKKEDRFETLRSLWSLTRDDLKSLSALDKISVSAALPLAAKQGWFEAVDALLSIGFDPLAQDEAGRTALGYCAEYGLFEHEVCAEIILSHENAADALKSVSWSTDDGCTPLLLAIDQGHEEMVRILLKNGCAVNEQGGREFSPLGDRSPLGDAITKGLEGIVRQLIDAGAELRPDHIDAARDGNSPDIKQLIYGYLRLLVHESPDRWMQHLADIIEYGDVETVQMLLQRGAIYSFEHIVLAVKKGQPEVQRLLLELVHKYVDEFPIHTKEWLLKLAEENDHDTLQALLDHGASAVWDGA